MAELVELYSKGIKRRLKNYWAAWLPGTPFKLGDVGTLNGYVFEKVGTLQELKIKYHAEPDAGPSPLDIASESGVTLSFKAAGETNAAFAHVGAAEAGAKIEFGAEGAFVLQAAQSFDSEMADRLNLRQQIVAAFARGKWEKDWLVITRVVKAPVATVVISRSENASVEMSAKANLSGVQAGLGDVGAGVSVKHKQGDTIGMIGGQNVTPLFQLSRLKTGFFGPPKLETKSLRAKDPSLADLTPERADGDRGIRDSLLFDVLDDDELLGP